MPQEIPSQFSLKAAIPDQLHRNSGRGMWKYRVQLEKHLQKAGLSIITPSPESTPKKQKQLIQLFSHEWIEAIPLKNKAIDITIYPFNVLPYNCVSNKHKTVLVLHDLIFLSKKWQGLSAFYRKCKLPYSLSNCSFILTVSESVKSQISRLIDNPQKIHLLPNALSDTYFKTVPSTPVSKTKRKIFHFGGLQEHKGTENVLRAFKQLLKKYNDLSLTIAGMSNNQEWLHSKIAALDIPQSQYEILPYLQDDELIQKLMHADIHLMPSCKEGFGIPVIEAAALKTLNVITDIDVFRETIGDHAIYMKDNQEISIYNALQTAMEQDTMNIIDLAYERAQKYSFERIHNECMVPFLNLYTETLKASLNT